MFRLPTVEAILEILITKADAKALNVLKDSPLCLVSDLTQYLSGNTISYLEFTQGMIASRTILKEIYENNPQQKTVPNMDALKEIALEQAP